MLLAQRKAKGEPIQEPDTTRQYGETIEKIRPDHVKRYIFAAGLIPRGKTVLDIACGCGYGSWLLHGCGLEVTGVDISSEAISYAEKHYQGPKYLCKDAKEIEGRWDAVVSFETLEHLEKPEDVLLNVRSQTVIASVPNELVLPFKAERFARDLYPHRRHYTPDEFEDLLESTGHPVFEKFCQKDKAGEVVPGVDGMFLIYVTK